MNTTQIVLTKVDGKIVTASILCSCHVDPLLVNWGVDKYLKIASLIARRDQHTALYHPTHLDNEAITKAHVSPAVVVDETDRVRPSTMHFIEMDGTPNAARTRSVSADTTTIRGKFKHQGIECGWRIFHEVSGGQIQVYMVPLATIIDRGQIPSNSRRSVTIVDGDTVVICGEVYEIKDDVRMSNPRLARV